MDEIAIFTREGFAFLARWGHFLSGITWIGLLYYFNFVQVPAFVTMGADARSEALRNIGVRALWWFRWGAALTVLTGFLILGFQEQFTRDYFTTSPGTTIAAGAILGIIMLANVWMVIWPAQQIVIASAETVAGGGEANPEAAPAGRRALLASRMNTLFSIPLLFFMGITGHLASFSSFFAFELSNDSLLGWWIIFAVVVGALELNALGRYFGYAPHWSKWPFESVRNVIISGFLLVAAFYIVFEIMFGATSSS